MAKEQTKALAEFPEVANALTGKKYVSQTDLARFQSSYYRATGRARRSIVTTYKNLGMSFIEMGEVLGLSSEEVELVYDQAVEEAVTILQDVPEGPFLMAQIVIEGFSTLTTASLNSINDMLRVELESTEPEHTAIQAYIRLRYDLLEKTANRMEKYGLLPSVAKSASSHGGVRANGKQKEEISFEDTLRQLARERGFELDNIVSKTIDASVQKTGSSDN